VPFVCFHNRDPAFLDNTQFSDNHRDWSYHSYRDSKPETYEKALSLILSKNIGVVRLGVHVSERLRLKSDLYFDYAASNARSDLGDLALLYNAMFTIVGDTGISLPAEAWNRPIVYCNWLPILRSPLYQGNALIIYKKLYFPGENRFLSFSEVMKINFENEKVNEYLTANGYKIIDNTPEEITEVVKEMIARIVGNWSETADDAKLQRQFWLLFGRYSENNKMGEELRVSSHFLRANRHLIC